MAEDSSSDIVDGYIRIGMKAVTNIVETKPEIVFPVVLAIILGTGFWIYRKKKRKQ